MQVRDHPEVFLEASGRVPRGGLAREIGNSRKSSPGDVFIYLPPVPLTGRGWRKLVFPGVEF